MVNCALPPICACCQARRFVYLPAWRYNYPGRRPETSGDLEPFETGMTASDNRMFAVTTREPTSVWSAPKQQNVPVSLRICAACGAAQPYVDPASLRVLIEGAEEQAVYVDHESQGDGPFR